MAFDEIFQPLKFRNLTREEPRVALERLRALRQLRRFRQSGAHQLGGQVREGWRGRHHLVLRARASARAHRPELRHDRYDDTDSVLDQGWRSRSRARLPLHPAAQSRRPAARLPGHPVPDGAELDGQAGSVARLPLRGDVAKESTRPSRRSPTAHGGPAKPGSTASSCTAPTAT